MNDNGVLAFLVNDPFGRVMVFVGDDQGNGAIDSGQNINGISGPTPSINNAGVVYNANLTTTTRAVLSNMPAPRTQLVTGEAFGSAGTNNSFGATRINNSGTVAVTAQANGLPLSNGGTRILTGNASGMTTAFETNAAGNGQGDFFSMFNLDMNSSGVLAFTGEDASVFRRSSLFIGTSQDDYIAAAVGGQTTAGGFTLNTISAKTPTINDEGDTAFIASTTTGRQGIFRRESDGTMSVVALSSGTDTSGFRGFSEVGMNNEGDVVFWASQGPSFTQGIYANGDEIISVGDSIGGRVVDQLVYSDAVNDAGQIGFFAHFSNGTSGIFRYDSPAGSSTQNPLMPNTVGGGGFGFSISLPTTGLGRNTPMFFDPIVAVGYEYFVSGATFNSVLLPSIGDGNFSLQVWNGTSYDSSVAVTANNEYVFGLNVSKFRVLGIEASAGLDPNDANAFVTGLTFTGGVQINVTMTPITFDTSADPTVTPEPASVSMMAVGFLGLAVATLRRRKCSRMSRTLQPSI